MLQPLGRRAAGRFRRVVQEAADASTAVDGGRGAFDDFQLLGVADGGGVVATVFHAAEATVEVVTRLATDEEGTGDTEIAAGEAAGRGCHQVVDRPDVVPGHHFRRNDGDGARGFGERGFNAEDAVGGRVGNHFERVQLGAYVHGGTAGAGGDYDVEGRRGACYGNIGFGIGREAGKLYFQGVSTRWNGGERILSGGVGQSSEVRGSFLFGGGYTGSGDSSTGSILYCARQTGGLGGKNRGERQHGEHTTGVGVETAFHCRPLRFAS